MSNPTSQTSTRARGSGKPRRISRTAVARQRLFLEPAEWMADGLCQQADPDAWFPEKGQPVEPARSICAGCPVRAECLAYALATDQRFGIWGGLSERARRQLRRARRQGDLHGQGGTTSGGGA